MKRIICLILVLMTAGLFAHGLAQEETETGLSAAEELDPAWENILLVGTDTRQDALEEGRADTTMIVSVNRKSGAIRLTSLARDMWIDLPGKIGHNRINTAYRFGGPEMMMQAVSETLGLNITRYAAINFYGFCDVIDALGGVEIEITRAEAQVINQSESVDYGSVRGEKIADGGLVTLTGGQALAYARIRKLDNDFGRTQRQRNVLIAVLDKVKTMSLTEQLSFVKECLACVSTNLGLGDIVTLGMTVLLNGAEDVKQLGLPSEGHYQYKTQDGMSTIVFDADALRTQAHEFIYGE